MKETRIHKLAVVGCLAALSSILMMLDFPVGIIPGFIKFDFSDVPALVASFAVGPVWGCAVALVKNLINVVISQSAGIGELANFIVSAAFVLPAGIVYKHTKERGECRALTTACIAGSACMALVSIPMNYFLVFPFYAAAYGTALETIINAFAKIYPFVDSLFEAVLVIMTPFNIAKAAVNSLLAVLVYKRLVPMLRNRL